MEAGELPQPEELSESVKGGDTVISSTLRTYN